MTGKKFLILPLALMLLSSSIPFSFGQDIAVEDSMAVSDAMTENTEQKMYMSPLKQFESGTPIESIICNAEKTLIQRANGNPACVKESSIERLEMRGWMPVPKYVNWCGTTGLCEPNDMDNEITDVLFDPTKRRIVDSSTFEHVAFSEPRPYTPPTVIFDYPEQVKVGEVATIHLNYTFAIINPQTSKYYTPGEIGLEEYHDTWIGLSFPQGIEIVSNGFEMISNGTSYHDRPVYFTSTHSKPIDNISTVEWHTTSFDFKFTKPMNTPRDFFNISLDGTVDHNGLSTASNVVTFLNERPTPVLGASDDVLYAINSTKYKHYEITPEDPNNPTYPPITEFADFLRNHIQTTNMTQFLLDDGLPQKYVDELFMAHPDLKQ